MKDRFEKLLELNSILMDENSKKYIENYVEQLLTLNKKINLISRKDEENLFERHIIPCLIFSILFKDFEGNVLDIGTGGGLPGIPFAIINQKSRLTLIDSILKKINAVNQIVQIIGLDNVETIWTRAEDKDFIKKYSNKFDLVISRATADLETLIKYSNPLFKEKNSKLAVLKGGEKLEEEIIKAKRRFNYIAIHKIPLIYLPENPNNINQKFAIIVERINGRK
ncbi:MAG: 16S rRNA (guanine(527)-N(7))-methyltransferase RsmG [Ignavibacteria bacterium]